MELLRILKSNDELAWMCIGDFNDIFHHHENMELHLDIIAKWKNFKQQLKDLAQVTLVIKEQSLSRATIEKKIFLQKKGWTELLVTQHGQCSLVALLLIP